MLGRIINGRLLGSHWAAMWTMKWVANIECDKHQGKGVENYKE